MTVPEWVKVLKVDGLHRHHLHYALGEKAGDDTIAKTSITGWPHGGSKVAPHPWPDKLAAWKSEGVLPSEHFR
jgi:hypothetical protein